MKNKIQFFIVVVVLFLMTIASKSVYADLNAREIRDSFNSMNGGHGFRFVPDVFVSPTLVTLTTQAGGYQNVDNSAYISGRSGSVGSPSRIFFQSFCVAPDLPVSQVGLGRLNYNETTGRSATSQGYALTLGAAYLYKEFATSSSPLGITGNIDTAGFANAIRALMGITIESNWTQNIYLSTLLSMNTRSYWTELYQVDQRYSEIGDYCVFVLNVTDANGLGRYQDFLYLAPAWGEPPVIPEPATILLWSLGGMGLFGTSWARKRRMKKLAIS